MGSDMKVRITTLQPVAGFEGFRVLRLDRRYRLLPNLVPRNRVPPVCHESQRLPLTTIDIPSLT